MAPSASWPLLCGAVFAAASAGAAEDPSAWLVRMDRALRELDYEGRLVYVHGTAVESLLLTHTAEGGRERLVSLNGPAREVVRDESELVCPVPEVGTVSVSRAETPGRGRALVALDLEHLGEAYEARLEGEARVAGRPARIVSLAPKDRFRYGQRLYLDTEFALPLKADLLDERGTPLTQTMFVSIDVRRQSPASMTAPAEPAPAGTPAGVEAALPWRVAGIPPGFRLAAFARRTLPGSGRELQHAVFSDGAASVSVYVASPGHHDLQGAADVGPVKAYGRRVGPNQVTAMGEVPTATLQAFVTGVHPEAEIGR